MCQSIPDPLLPDNASPEQMCDFYIKKAMVSAMQDCLPQPVFVNSLMKFAVLLTHTNCIGLRWRDFIEASYEYWVEEAEKLEG